MGRAGLLETMARADLDALLEEVATGYRPGTLGVLAADDQEWREALDRIEREVGALYDALCEADITLARWRRAVADLYRLWARVREHPTVGEPPALDEVA